MFFQGSRAQFFKPLTSKYREQVVQCLCLLYQRLYSANADYGHALNREQVVEILEEALARAPVLEAEDDAEDDATRFKNPREQAHWVLKQLLEYGWIDKQVDAATMQSSYPFSRLGRLFTQPLVESSATRVRTRHRNTRNTLNALEAFASRGEVYDLLDAYEYSERIVTDFTDVIAELEERKRQLVAKVESQQLVQLATDQFFEFMEKRFAPDVSVRLSADSVEKYRDRIERQVNRIRRKKTDVKRALELELRRQVPELALPGQSVLWTMLDTIERRMANAAEVMLPALRRALHSFTKRADIIIRQLSYLNSQQGNDLTGLCQRLQSLPAAEAEQVLGELGDALAGVRVQLVDPAQVRLLERKAQTRLHTAVPETEAIDHEAQRELMIQQLLDQAFALNNRQLYDYLLKTLRSGKTVSSAELPIENATDLLAMAHIIEVAAINSTSSEHRFAVTPTGVRTQHPYFHTLDEFTLDLLPHD